MRRFFLLLLSEFRQTRTALVIHGIAVLQPTLIFLLMGAIMVVPIFDMRVVEPQIDEGEELVAAMGEIGSPIGLDYIQPILVEEAEPGHRQVIEVIDVNGKPTALQAYGSIDSNLVKNLRNRLTAALLVMWNDDLGDRAITIEQYPWLPEDIPYTLYFGMAMIPLAIHLAAAMIGGYLTAQEFEHDTILEFRLSPTPAWLILAARITRLLLTGFLAGLLMYLAVGLMTGVWAQSAFMVFLILLPLNFIAACLGLAGGLLTRSSLPAFLIALASAFAFWLMGSGFGLAAGFPDLFETISRLIPNTPTIELIFPCFYDGRIVAQHPGWTMVQLIIYCWLMLALVAVLYRKRVLAKQR